MPSHMQGRPQRIARIPYARPIRSFGTLVTSPSQAAAVPPGSGAPRRVIRRVGGHASYRRPRKLQPAYRSMRGSHLSTKSRPASI
jgi:hypothetical protein